MPNRKHTSKGALTAVRKRTMDKAPTMPRERSRLELMVSTMKAVTTLTSTSRMFVRCRGFIRK